MVQKFKQVRWVFCSMWYQQSHLVVFSWWMVWAHGDFIHMSSTLARMARSIGLGGTDYQSTFMAIWRCSDFLHGSWFLPQWACQENQRKLHGHFWPILSRSWRVISAIYNWSKQSQVCPDSREEKYTPHLSIRWVSKDLGLIFKLPPLEYCWNADSNSAGLGWDWDSTYLTNLQVMLLLLHFQ